MRAADLAQWTPVQLNVINGEPFIDWCDLSAVEFTDPFFSQTIDRALTTNPNLQIVRTGLSVLAEIEAEYPGRDPAGFVFHAARCGSTLVSSLAAKVPGVAVVSEPEPLNSLLDLNPARINQSVQVDCIRLLVRAFCRSRAESRHVVLKLSSWNILRAPLLLAAFPDCPRAFVYRDPLEILGSLLQAPPGWLMLHAHDSAKAAWLFGPKAAAAPSQHNFAVAAMAEFFSDALMEDDKAPMLLVNYADLPDACWRDMLPHFGRPLLSEEAAMLAEQAQWDAKNPDRKFVPDGDAKRRHLAADLGFAVANRIDPFYTELQRRQKRRAA